MCRKRPRRLSSLINVDKSSGDGSCQGRQFISLPTAIALPRFTTLNHFGPKSCKIRAYCSGPHKAINSRSLYGIAEEQIKTSPRQSVAQVRVSVFPCFISSAIGCFQERPRISLLVICCCVIACIVVNFFRKFVKVFYYVISSCARL